MEELLNIPDLSSKFGIRNRAILELIYSSGLRISEIASCKIGQIDLQEKLIRVIGKGNKERIVPISSKAKIAIRNYLLLGINSNQDLASIVSFYQKAGDLVLLMRSERSFLAIWI